MKRLWKKITPCYSDIYGFLQVIQHSDGFAIVDDSSRYKNRQRENSVSFMQRNVSSHIREEDVVCGTKEKVLEAYRNCSEISYSQFLLLSSAPCSSMINTDYQEICDFLEKELDFPVGYVFLDGQKDYLYGTGVTLETLGKMLLSVSTDKISNGINLLGCNLIDFQEDDVVQMETFLEQAGFSVLTKWGANETVEHLKKATSAEINLVVNISGLRLAQFMEETFSIPYVVGCPIGEKNRKCILEKLRWKKTDSIFSSAPEEEVLEIVIIGEQVLANSIREELLAKGFHGIGVYSFSEMEKKYMSSLDRKLVSEDELKELLCDEHVQMFFGEDDYRSLCNDTVHYYSLPNTMKLNVLDTVFYSEIEKKLNTIKEVS